MLYLSIDLCVLSRMYWPMPWSLGILNVMCAVLASECVFLAMNEIYKPLSRLNHSIQKYLTLALLHCACSYLVICIQLLASKVSPYLGFGQKNLYCHASQIWFYAWIRECSIIPYIGLSPIWWHKKHFISQLTLTFCSLVISYYLQKKLQVFLLFFIEGSKQARPKKH